MTNRYQNIELQSVTTYYPTNASSYNNECDVCKYYVIGYANEKTHREILTLGDVGLVTSVLCTKCKKETTICEQILSLSYMGHDDIRSSVSTR